MRSNNNGVNKIIEGLEKTRGESLNKKDRKADKKELDILYNLTDALNEELKTEKYTMTPSQRNVVYTLTKGFHSRSKMLEGYTATLRDGFFNTSFNSDDTADEFMENLEEVLGVRGKFYFEKVSLNGGNATQIPGFNFRGYPVTGVIYETRLFKK